MRTICYLDVGSAENNRPAYSRLSATSGLLGKAYLGFASQGHIDIRCYPEFIQIMDDRLRMCRGKGFDYIKVDVMDAFEDGAAVTGLPLTRQDMINYVTAMSARAQLWVEADAEECERLCHEARGAVRRDFARRLCAGQWVRDAAPYVNAGKPTFKAEYPESWPGSIYRARTCSVSVTAKVSTIITVVHLDRPAPDRYS